MKSRRRQNNRPHQFSPASRVGNIPVHRYSHPISTKSPVRHASATEDLLSELREVLARQSEMLEELLRRTEGYISDAK